MKMLAVVFSLFVASVLMAEEAKNPYLDEETTKIVKAIEAAGAYKTPDIGLRRDPKYAKTAEDVAPFAGIEPYKQHFLDQMEYTGPGRGIPEPSELKSVKLGFIGPIESTVSIATGGKSHEESLGRMMLKGSQLAIEEANADGGYWKRKIPFELVISNDNGLWGASGNEIIKMAYKDAVWGILGTIDGANSHIAIRVALKAELPMISTGNTDPTFIETNIPWAFRTIGDDRQQAYLLVDYLIKKMNYQRIAIIRASNRYGRFGVREVHDSARRLGRPVVIEMAYKLGGQDYKLQLERIKDAKPDAIVHWGNAIESALILNQMRKMDMRQPYFANDRTVSEDFVKTAQANAEGVMCGFPWNPESTAARFVEFKQRFIKRFGEEPETQAAHAYDGMNMLIWAIQAVGLNRANIRDVLAFRIKPWPGVTGDIKLSAALDDEGEVYLTKFEQGKWHYLSRKDLGL